MTFFRTSLPACGMAHDNAKRGFSGMFSRGPFRMPAQVAKVLASVFDSVASE